MPSDTTIDAGATAQPMKTCRFCFEPIRQEAVKCRHCGSFVSDPEPTTGSDRPIAKTDQQVVYILDKDLVRFGKFALAILTLIIVIGTLLYGIDIKRLRADIEREGKFVAELGDEMKDERAAMAELGKEMTALSDGMFASLEDAEILKDQIRSEVEAARASAKRAETALSDILETQSQASLTLESIVSMQDGSFSIRRATVTTPSEDAAPHGKLWENGTTLHVRFIGGTPTDREEVERWAKKWSDYANIRFVFDDDPRAEIRISFDESEGSWSYVGRDNLDVPIAESAATMNLGWVDKASILRNFGLVLGLENEHQNPYDPVPWNDDAVYASFGAPPNNWSREMIEFNILQTYPEDTFPTPKPFDPDSVMLYGFEDEFTVGEFPLIAGEDLSDGDKEFIAALYPKS